MEGGGQEPETLGERAQVGAIPDDAKAKIE